MTVREEEEEQDSGAETGPAGSALQFTKRTTAAAPLKDSVISSNRTEEEEGVVNKQGKVEEVEAWDAVVAEVDSASRNGARTTTGQWSDKKAVSVRRAGFHR